MGKKKEKTIVVKTCTICLIGVIHGLEREGEKVKYAFKRMKPDCIAVGIPKEDIAILKKYNEGEIEFETTPYQDYFFECLSSYGKVSIPPKDLLTAYTLSVKEGIPFEPIDLDDEEYATVFTENVSLLSILKSSRRMKKLAKKKFFAQGAEEFVEEWEKWVSPKSFYSVENAREEKMASRLFFLANKHKRILAIIPYQRFDGVLQKITQLKKA
ncbi:MAG: hypothetical protein FE048_04795 [Thermoplasmata archaeon]|nr:MAG: hypothetical protein FE048_04795 [Thermoplasmata archaeon]